MNTNKKTSNMFFLIESLQLWYIRLLKHIFTYIAVGKRLLIISKYMGKRLLIIYILRWFILIRLLCICRKQRFERVTKNLKVTRAITTIVEEIRLVGNDATTEAVAHCDRSPVLLFMGGGMGAGKSTVLKEILKK